MAVVEPPVSKDEHLAEHVWRMAPIAKHQAIRITNRLTDDYFLIHRDGIYESVREKSGQVEAGTGPERAVTNIHANPNWLRNRAANFLNIADYLENRERVLVDVEAAKAAAREKRRDELATEIFGGRNYADLRAGAPAAVDRIIQLEDAAK